MAAPFDLATQTVTGDAVTVLTDVMVYGGGATQFAVSNNGTIVFGQTAGSFDQTAQFEIVDLEGQGTVLPFRALQFHDPRFSPDGSRVAYEGLRGIGVYDLDTGENLQLTTGGEVPIWSGDGQSIYLGGTGGAGGDETVLQVPADASGSRERVMTREGRHHPLGHSPTGSLLLGERSPDRGWDLLVVDLSTDPPTVTNYLRADWNESMAALSSDGRIVAYVSDERGADRISLRRFPEPGEAVAIALDGATEPRWAPDQSAVYFRAAGSIWRASVTTDGAIEVGAPEMMFEDRWLTTIGSRRSANWDVDPDGASFIFVGTESGTDEDLNVPVIPVVIVANWFTDLRERMGG